MDIQKEKDAFLNVFQFFKSFKGIGFSEETEQFFLKKNKPNDAECLDVSNLNQMWRAWWARAKSQAVPEWISTSDRMPEEGDAVLFLDKNDTIHDGYLSTDYVDGPYGENGEDFGGDQTLWSSNSNGEELFLNKVKYWMHRPSNPSASKSGAKS